MAKAHKITGVNPLGSYRENARTILPQKVEEVWTWEPFIRDAARRKELHNMRISIKRLRYTMEFFRVAYGLPEARSTQAGEGFKSSIIDKRFVEYLEVIMDLQEILGDIHDSDVVLEVLKDYTDRPGFRTPPASGVATLIAQTQETRKADYETFLKKWDQLSEAGFKKELLSFFGRNRL